MMRLGRRASLLVAFSLLNLAEVGAGTFCYPAPRSAMEESP